MSRLLELSVDALTSVFCICMFILWSEDECRPEYWRSSYVLSRSFSLVKVDCFCKVWVESYFWKSMSLPKANKAPPPTKTYFTSRLRKELSIPNCLLELLSPTQSLLYLSTPAKYPLWEETIISRSVL